MRLFTREEDEEEKFFSLIAEEIWHTLKWFLSSLEDNITMLSGSLFFFSSHLP